MTNPEDLYHENEEVPEASQKEDKLEISLKIISFIVPLVGIILYFVHRKEHPKKAWSACNMALWGVGIGFVLNVIVKMVIR